MRLILLIITIGGLLFVQTGFGQKPATKVRPKPQSQTTAEKTEYPNLKSQAEEVGQATVSGDFAKLIDYTYPKIVEKFGGKDKMIAFLKNDAARRKADGFEIEDFQIGEVKQTARVENEIYAIVLMTMKFITPSGRFRGESSVVGISNDNGVNWKFVNGIDQDKFKGLFPKAAEKIQIPESKPPQAIENE